MEKSFYREENVLRRSSIFWEIMIVDYYILNKRVLLLFVNVYLNNVTTT